MVGKQGRVKRRGGEQKKYERAAMVGEGGRRWRVHILYPPLRVGLGFARDGKCAEDDERIIR